MPVCCKHRKRRTSEYVELRDQGDIREALLLTPKDDLHHLVGEELRKAAHATWAILELLAANKDLLPEILGSVGEERDDVLGTIDMLARDDWPAILKMVTSSHAGG
jgi:hypothetical protein